jgi:hypothetical protein
MLPLRLTTYEARIVSEKKPTFGNLTMPDWFCGMDGVAICGLSLHYAVANTSLLVPNKKVSEYHV